jgi:chemotaxis protein MotB
MPEPENSAPPVIVIKKKSNHGGHHGGAWKVAYADFVTAMMALFIVLWLLSSSEKVKKSVASYFKDPSGNGKEVGSTMKGTGEGVAVTKDDMAQLKEKLEQALETMPKFQQMKDNVELTITDEGLRIELIENEKGLFFESGSAHPTDRGQELLLRLAEELGHLPNTLLIEGHTDAKPYAGATTYSNWELSADRSNSARRLMQTSELRPDQVAQVRGFADQRLRTPKEPNNPSNRRISVIVQYLPKAAAPHLAEKPPGDKPLGGKPAGEKSAAEKPATEKPAPEQVATAKPAPGKPVAEPPAVKAAAPVVTTGAPPAKTAAPPPVKAAH